MGGGAGGALIFRQIECQSLRESRRAPRHSKCRRTGRSQRSSAKRVVRLPQPKKYQDIGAQNRRGILLVGPPGTGKTLLARLYSGRNNCAVLQHIRFRILQVEMFVGRGTAKSATVQEANEPLVSSSSRIDTIGKSATTAISVGTMSVSRP